MAQQLRKKEEREAIDTLRRSASAVIKYLDRSVSAIPGSTDWEEVADRAGELAYFAGKLAEETRDGNEIYKEEENEGKGLDHKNSSGEDRRASEQPKEAYWGHLGAYGIH